jgi:VWFA-related protein
MHPERVNVTLRSVDASRFPEVSVILDARDTSGAYFPNLRKSDLQIYQDGRLMKIESLTRVSAENSMPVDIAFVIDQTGSMRQEVNEVKTNIAEFTLRLARKGVDYQLGLVTFSDFVERKYNFTSDVNQFIGWIDNLVIGGGGDDNENALQGMEAAVKQLNWRKNSQRIIILITDAMFHQKGDKADGQTDYTTQSMAAYLVFNNVQLFAITPPDIDNYRTLTEATNGKRFNIIEDFSSILDVFSEAFTSLHAAKYRVDDQVPPENITLEIRNSQNELVLSERVPIIDVDKKFVLENILFDFNKATLSNVYNPTLHNMLGMMRTYPTVEIEIRGHTDMVGSDEYNFTLSEARARAVKKYLTDFGISGDRITCRGMGKSHPIAPNDTELGRRLNRRTEIVITKK